MSRSRDTRTYDLLAWEPPQPAKAFAPEKVRAASLRSMVCRAVAAALKECGKDRDQVAEEIGTYLGEPCAKTMLDAYASEAREDHTIPLIRFLGLVHATGDIRLLQVLANQFGWAVVPQKYLPAIEESIIADKIEELQQRRVLARKTWKGA
ncbi:MAG TPA: DNA transposition protein [Azospirillum sp.]|nr:DNA transposition protein [Azospirillum sp.]